MARLVRFILDCSLSHTIPLSVTTESKVDVVASATKSKTLAYYASMIGKTITQMTYYTADGVYVLPVNVVVPAQAN